MTNPFLIILSLALWEIIKYIARNLREMAADAYHVRFSRYEAYNELKAFKHALKPNKEPRMDYIPPVGERYFVGGF